MKYVLVMVSASSPTVTRVEAAEIVAPGVGHACDQGLTRLGCQSLPSVAVPRRLGTLRLGRYAADGAPGSLVGRRCSLSTGSRA
jgi:hypothetical protein